MIIFIYIALLILLTFALAAAALMGLRYMQNDAFSYLYPTPAETPFFDYMANSVGLAVAAMAGGATIVLALQALRVSRQQVDLELRSAFESEIDSFRKDMALAEDLLREFVEAGLDHAKAVKTHAEADIEVIRNIERDALFFDLLPAQGREDWQKNHYRKLVDAMHRAISEKLTDLPDDASHEDVISKDEALTSALEELETEARDLAACVVLNPEDRDEMIAYLRAVGRQEGRRMAQTRHGGTIDQLNATRHSMITCTERINAFLEARFANPITRRVVQRAGTSEEAQKLVARIKRVAASNESRVYDMNPPEVATKDDELGFRLVLDGVLTLIFQFASAPTPLWGGQITDAVVDEDASKRMRPPLRQDMSVQVQEASRWLPELGLSLKDMKGSLAFEFDDTTDWVCAYTDAQNESPFVPEPLREDVKKKDAANLKNVLSRGSLPKVPEQKTDFYLVCEFLSVILQPEDPGEALAEHLVHQGVDSRTARRFSSVVRAGGSKDSFTLTPSSQLLTN
ncbi:hypothetical protein J3456_16565 [Sulfitobacter sp. NFXS29]|uniref:hypothetical protein n=1 Tax=Sulfitobacter sp. NFXS29 TaxID=2818438 RepID=UPI0032DE4CCC